MNFSKCDINILKLIMNNYKAQKNNKILLKKIIDIGRYDIEKSFRFRFDVYCPCCGGTFYGLDIEHSEQTLNHIVCECYDIISNQRPLN